MSLQKRTLARYRQYFPHETLREVSARTGIQITRVFRLFNGKTMKVGELEAFENAIHLKIDENPAMAMLSQSVEEAGAVLTNDELMKVTEYIQRKVKSRAYSRLYIRSEYTNAIIA